MATDLREFLAQPPEPEFFYCRPLLPRRGKTFISGSAKTLKSFLSLNLAYDLCEGAPIWGIFPVLKPARVLYIEQEIGPAMLREERLAKLHAHRAGTQVLENLWIESKDTRMRLDTREGLDLISRCIELAQPHVVIFDPLRKFHMLKEDPSEHASYLMRAVDDLQAKYNFSALIVHHHSKPSEFRRGDHPEAMRGSSVFHDEGDAYITVTKVDPRNDRLVALHSEFRHAPEMAPFTMELDPETAGFKISLERKKVLHEKAKRLYIRPFKPPGM